MGLEKDSNQIGVRDYFVNPIAHQGVVRKYLIEGKNSDCSESDVTLSKYLNEKAISEMIGVNSEISRILNAFKIPVKINLKVLHNLIKNHLPQTRKVALGMAKYLPEEQQRLINHKALAEATVLHDLAKVILPENIINKEGALSEHEHEIMEKHAKLSYELLKTTDLDAQTLDLIKNHHGHDEKNCSEDDINLQILSMADIYSALREKRSYKPALSRESSLRIIEKEVQYGKFDKEVYEALVKYSKSESLFGFNFNRKIFDFEFVNSFSA